MSFVGAVRRSAVVGGVVVAGWSLAFVGQLFVGRWALLFSLRAVIKVLGGCRRFGQLDLFVVVSVVVVVWVV